VGPGSVEWGVDRGHGSVEWGGGLGGPGSVEWGTW